MSIPAYPSYKDSGVEWLGAVPVHWVSKPLFAVVRERSQSNAGMLENNLLSLSYGAIVRKDINDNDGLLPASFETYQIVEPKDIVWRLTDLQNDKRSLRTAIVQERGIITSAYLATEATGILPEFLNYLLRAYDITKVFYSMGGGLRQSMKFSDVKWLPVTLPPLPEQTAIAAFLDRETGKIDALVVEQQRLISLLKEKRQAAISHAVTKGLNPAAPMKGSGIEWLGEVPAHWQLKPLKAVASCNDDVLGEDTLPETEIEYVEISGVELQKGIIGSTIMRFEGAPSRARRRVQDGDVAISTVRTYLRAIAAIQAPPANLVFSTGFAILRPYHINSIFLGYFVRSEYFISKVISQSVGISYPAINASEIMTITTPLPPLSEQFTIAAFLDHETARLDELSVEAEFAITLLQERRTALISAAVTGKIDVRGTAQIITFPVGRARARFLVGISITERFSSQQYFGRVKLQKIAYLIETHCGVSELDGNYLREAAGPLDREMIQEIEGQMQGSGHVCVEQPAGDGTAVSYKICGTKETYRDELNSFLGARIAKVEALLRDLEPLNTKGVEAIATLYAVWNDELIDGRTPDDESIVSAVLNDWHIEKKVKFKPDELHNWLGWMRRHGVVPSGKGSKTLIGRLFV